MAEEIEEIRRRKLEELQNRDAAGAEGAADDAAPETPSEPIRVDGRAELTDVVSDHGVVLVDFYADWCGPCQMLEPVVESIAAETDAVVAKVDVDANQGLAAEYGVRGVPTLLLFAEGETVERLVGMQDESRLRNVIEAHA
jgi:thioredoxin 1